MIKNLEKHFEHIYLLTIPRNVDRLNNCINLLGDLNYEIFYGVDGGSYTTVTECEELGLFDRSRFGRLMSLGEIGCALSHINIYKDIVEKNYKNALILEDDFTLGDFSDFDDIYNDLPINWDLFYLGYGASTFLGRYNRLFTELKCLERTHAYAISNIGAQKMINFNFPVKYPADNALIYNYSSMNCFASYKQIFNYRTDIGSSIWNIHDGR